MNAEELIEEVIDVVDDDDYADSEVILKYLNQAQQNIADNLYLPDLEDGYDSIDTIVDGYTVPVPPTYHKGLYLARCGDIDLDIHSDIRSMVMIHGSLNVELGDLDCILADKRTVTYQNVPSTVTAIDLFFYRRPLPMTESTTSLPDGVEGNDDFEWALVHKAAALIFNRIEDGMEGPKVNTDKHTSLFGEKMLMLDVYSEGIGKTFPSRPSSNLDWLGVK